MKKSAREVASVADQHRNALQPGYKLLWYDIKRIIGQGGFGITYLAHDLNLDQPVAIKEYLPVELSVREHNSSVVPISAKHNDRFKWGLQRFIAEARTLAKFNHPHIVSVLSVFEGNKTAYMVMNYEEGESLHVVLNRRKTLEEKELKDIVLPILDGLKNVHKAGFIHRDIKPDNIIIRKNNKPVLLDFGSARRALDNHTRTLTSVVSPGYAPFEQYYAKSDQQGPWTDIYSLGATLYRGIVGVAPMDAISRGEGILKASKDTLVSANEAAAENYSKRFLTAVDHAIQFRESDRPQSVEEWLKELVGSGPAKSSGAKPRPAAAAEPRTTVQAASPSELFPDDSEFGESTTAAIDSVPSLRVDVDSVPHAHTNGRRRRLTGWLASAAAVVVAAVLVWAFREPIVGWTETARLLFSAPAEEQVAASAEPEPPAVTEEQRRSEQIGLLIAAAQADVQEDRLTSPPGNNALERFSEVLEMDNENTMARQGITDILALYIERTSGAIDAGRLNEAEEQLAVAEAISPGEKVIGELRTRIRKARNRQQRIEESQIRARRVLELLRLAEADVEAGRLIDPVGNNAVERYREVLQLNPNNGRAKQGSVDVANTLKDWATDASLKGNFADAYTYLDKAALILTKPENLDILRAERRLVDERKLARELARKRAAELEERRRSLKTRLGNDEPEEPQQN
ncbi:MAG: protein kinase domain-containing protein [Gammaproteobacteria bacterium]